MLKNSDLVCTTLSSEAFWTDKSQKQARQWVCCGGYIRIVGLLMSSQQYARFFPEDSSRFKASQELQNSLLLSAQANNAHIASPGQWAKTESMAQSQSIHRATLAIAVLDEEHIRDTPRPHGPTVLPFESALRFGRRFLMRSEFLRRHHCRKNKAPQCSPTGDLFPFHSTAETTRWSFFSDHTTTVLLRPFKKNAPAKNSRHVATRFVQYSTQKCRQMEFMTAVKYTTICCV